MIVKFLKSSTKQAIKPQIEGEFEDVSNEYNLFVADAIESGADVLGEAELENGAIVRRFNNDTEIHLVPNVIQ